TKIDWGDGNIDDWTVHKAYPVEAILKGRNPETGIAAEPLKGEYSYKDKPITYLKFQYFQPSYANYWYINIEGYNMTTNAWEEIFYHYAVSRPSGAFEQTWSTPYYTRWRVECECYQYNQYTGYYEFEYMVEDFNLTGGYLEVPHMYPDDMPTATPWDLYDISIELREDDLGYDKVYYKMNVSSVAPTLDGGELFTISSSPWVSGKFGSALKFDGIDDYVDCGNDATLKPPLPVTLSAWVKLAVVGETGAPPHGSPISKAEAGTTWSWQIRYNAPGGNYLGFQCNDITAGSTWVSVKQALTPDTWYHIAAKFDKTASTMSMYLDGVMTDSTSLSGIRSGTSKLFIGYDGWPGNFFNGKIDDVAIFDRALSPTEIQRHMTNGVGGGSSLPTSLAGYWNLDEGTGDLAHDSSGNKNVGIIYGRTTAVTEEYLAEKGIDEGSSISFEGFTFDDVAYDEPTETFDYQIDWGDGTVTPWMDDFRYTEEISGGGAGGGKALVAWADSNDQGLTTYLQTDSRFSLVDAWNVRQTTGSIPTLEKMLEYDVIVTWTNYQYFNKNLFGDRLKDYVDKGGGVVVCTFAHHMSTWNIGGAFQTNNYDPIQPTNSYSSVSTTIGTV
ncbi:MAG: LamG domain-containing protein, partial [Thermoplasmata archaeon]|nr:LamG domain-containing protein [Thermoplasmata archaeon]